MSDHDTECNVYRSLKKITAQEDDLWVNTITSNNIKDIIRKLRTYKAPGGNRVQMKVLKMLSKKALIQLFYIHEANAGFDHFPRKWRVIISIKKSGKDSLDQAVIDP